MSVLDSYAAAAQSIQHQAQNNVLQNQAFSNQLGQPMQAVAGYPTQQPYRPPSLADSIRQSKKVFEAKMKVLEFFEAQSHMGLFGEDKDAQYLFEQVLGNAIKQVIHGQ